MVKNAPANAEDMIHGFDPFVRKIPDPLQKGVVAYSSIPAWRIPWAEETGGLRSLGLQRVGHDWSDVVCISCLVLKLLSRV